MISSTNSQLLSWGLAYVGIDTSEALKHFSLIKERNPEGYEELISTEANNLLNSLLDVKKKERKEILQKCQFLVSLIE
jgi:hypothetical protein